MSRRPIRVAIVGAGLGGIAAAVALTRAGFTDFTVFERAAGPGGVWWQNTYPGCEVDIPSHAYSYSFMPYDWSGTHAGQPELVGYARAVIDRYGIGDRIRFGVTVRQVRWRPERAGYTVRTSAGTPAGQPGTGSESESDFDVVVSAVGMLSDPKLPDWPGLDTFAGPVFHTSRYDHDLDLTGKRVAIVGTGSSACQLGPALAPMVGRLDVYQREPGYVLPKRSRRFDDTERRRLAGSATRQRIERLRLFHTGLRTHDALRVGTENHRRAESAFARYLDRTVHDPQVRELLRPAHPYGCKRPVFASTYLPMFNRDNVTLVPHAVREVAPDGLVDDTGTKRPADVLILSTGFQAARYLCSLPVLGRDGTELQRTWDGEPWAFLGLTVPGYPNFFMMYGPNTNGGFSVVAQHEIQADLIVRALRRLRRGRGGSLDTRAGPARRVDRWVQSRIAVTMSSLGTGCHNYFHSASGRNVTQWPMSHTAYRAALRVLAPLVLSRSGG